MYIASRPARRHVETPTQSQPCRTVPYKPLSYPLPYLGRILWRHSLEAQREAGLLELVVHAAANDGRAQAAVVEGLVTKGGGGAGCWRWDSVPGEAGEPGTGRGAR